MAIDTYEGDEVIADFDSLVGDSNLAANDCFILPEVDIIMTLNKMLTLLSF